jgi:hypothetical protein
MPAAKSLAGPPRGHIRSTNTRDLAFTAGQSGRHAYEGQTPDLQGYVCVTRCHVLLAMPKVEGSNPSAAFQKV